MNIGEAILTNGVEASRAQCLKKTLRPRLTDEQIRAVKRMFANGELSSDIAAHFGVSPQTVLRARSQ